MEELRNPYLLSLLHSTCYHNLHIPWRFSAQASIITTWDTACSGYASWLCYPAVLNVLGLRAAVFASSRLQLGGRCHESEIFNAFKRAYPKYRQPGVVADTALRDMVSWKDLVPTFDVLDLTAVRLWLTRWYCSNVHVVLTRDYSGISHVLGLGMPQTWKHPLLPTICFLAGSDLTISFVLVLVYVLVCTARCSTHCIQDRVFSTCNLRVHHVSFRFTGLNNQCCLVCCIYCVLYRCVSTIQMWRGRQRDITRIWASNPRSARLLVFRTSLNQSW